MPLCDVSKSLMKTFKAFLKPFKTLKTNLKRNFLSWSQGKTERITISNTCPVRFSGSYCAVFGLIMGKYLSKKPPYLDTFDRMGSSVCINFT